MNWIPKERNNSKQPSEAQQLKEYFKRHRRPLPAAETHATDNHNIDRRSPASSTGSSSSGHPSRVSRQESSKRKRQSENEDSRSSSDRRSGLDKLDSVPKSLAEMDMTDLAWAVKGTQRHISTDLVHLEMIKRVFAFRPKSPSPPPAELPEIERDTSENDREFVDMRPDTADNGLEYTEETPPDDELHSEEDFRQAFDSPGDMRQSGKVSDEEEPSVSVEKSGESVCETTEEDNTSTEPHFLDLSSFGRRS